MKRAREEETKDGGNKARRTSAAASATGRQSPMGTTGGPEGVWNSFHTNSESPVVLTAAAILHDPATNVCSDGRALVASGSIDQRGGVNMSMIPFNVSAGATRFLLPRKLNQGADENEIEQNGSRHVAAFLSGMHKMTTMSILMGGCKVMIGGSETSSSLVLGGPACVEGTIVRAGSYTSRAGAVREQQRQMPLRIDFYRASLASLSQCTDLIPPLVRLIAEYATPNDPIDYFYGRAMLRMLQRASARSFELLLDAAVPWFQTMHVRGRGQLDLVCSSILDQTDGVTVDVSGDGIFRLFVQYCTVPIRVRASGRAQVFCFAPASLRTLEVTLEDVAVLHLRSLEVSQRLHVTASGDARVFVTTGRVRAASARYDMRELATVVQEE